MGNGTFTKQQMVIKLKKFIEKTGSTSIREYQKECRYDQISATTIKRAFGSWSEAIQEASKYENT